MKRINAKREKYFWSQYRYNNPVNVPAHWDAFGINDGEYTDEQIHFFVNRVKSVSSVVLANSWVTEDGVEVLCNLKGVKYLDIRNLNLTDAIVPYLIKFQELEILFIQNNMITPKGVKTLLERLPVLQELIHDIHKSDQEEMESILKNHPDVDCTIDYFEYL